MLTALALLIIVALAAADEGGALRVDEPRTEYRDNPLGAGDVVGIALS